MRTRGIFYWCFGITMVMECVVAMPDWCATTSKPATAGNFNLNSDCPLKNTVALSGSTDVLVIEGTNRNPLFKIHRPKQSSTLYRLFILKNESQLILNYVTLTGADTIGSRLPGKGGPSGGAIYVQGSSLQMYNSLMISNIAYRGGGAFIAGSFLSINTTISHNTAYGDGGGVWCEEWLGSTTSCVFKSTTVVLNSVVNPLGGGGGVDCAPNAKCIFNEKTIVAQNSCVSGGVLQGVQIQTGSTGSTGCTT